MHNPFDRRAKTAPSQYPRLPFHLIRLSQLVSSIVVGCIMIYFIWHLTHDNWRTPWTFVWLCTASICSVVALAFTMVLHCCVGLNPRFNLACNAFLLVLWTLSWSLLTWYMAGTLRNVCDVEHWDGDVGIMICRVYKALFTFTLTGFVSTIAAFVLDIYVHRQQTRRGIYRLHDLDTKGRSEATRDRFTENETSQPRESEAWEAPRPSMGPYGEQSDRTMFQQGYNVPENQFDYDTGYHGHDHEKL